MTQEELRRILSRRTKAELAYSIRVTEEAASILKSPIVNWELAEMKAELNRRA